MTRRLFAWLFGLALIFPTNLAAQSEGFAVHAVPDSIWTLMQGRSVPKGAPVKRSDLRYLTLLHVDDNGRTRQGEMVVNKAVAKAVLDIFQKLFEAGYRLSSVRLIDRFDASDRRSMLANNSSGFCYRHVAGSKVLSKHSQGMAVDLNPLYNPYVKRRANGTLRVDPPEAARYANRKASFPHKITAASLPVQLFRQHGFAWGGSWRSVKDYQHFEK